MIDLHTHTNESDGTYSPEELVDAALAVKLEALAITDHDTFAGYDLAEPIAKARGLDLVCGIELSTRMPLESSRGSSSQASSQSTWKTVHLLGYFVKQPPSGEFRAWLGAMQANRRERNLRLIESLKRAGVNIELAEVEALGRSLAGRPHFARLLVQKGYVESADQAFRRYLGETASTFVERESPELSTAIHKITSGGGIPVTAHPIRLGMRDHEREELLIAAMCGAGLQGLEVFHSDHTRADTERYAALANKYGLAATGGSDFHGGVKPNISLGTGIHGNLNVPVELLAKLRT